MLRILLSLAILALTSASAPAQQVMSGKGNGFSVTTRDGGDTFVVASDRGTNTFSGCEEDMDLHMTTDMTFDCKNGNSKLRIELRRNPVSNKWRIHSATIR